MDNLYILDGYGLIYRSYYAFQGRTMTNAKGENIAAVLAFYRSLFLFFKTYQPSNFIVALDGKEKTFRDELYSDYKANRQKAPADLHSQTLIIEEILAALGIKMLRVEGFEADDIIATLCKKREIDALKSHIISSDKDLMQLVNNFTDMLRPSNNSGFIHYNQEAVLSDKGVLPSQINDYLAIVGDSSDNIPGVAGLGPKAAEKLLKEYGSLDNIYSHISDVRPQGYKEKLIINKDLAYMSYQLAALCYNVPLAPLLEQELSTSNLNFAAIAPIFIYHGIPSLASDALKYSNENPCSLSSSSQLFIEEVKKSIIDLPRPEESGIILNRYDEEKQHYQLIKTEEQLNLWLLELENVTSIAFDCETDGLDSNQASPVGFSICYKKNHAVYIPIKASIFDAVINEEVVRSALRSLLSRPDIKIVGQNIKFDYKILKRWGVIFTPYFDTMIASILIDSESPANMDFLAERYLNYQTSHFNDLVDKNSTFDMINLQEATIYAAEDADITWQLFEKLLPLLEEKKIATLFWQLEMPLIIILAEMELTGIYLNTNHLNDFNLKLKNDLTLLTVTIESLAGKSFNIASPKQLAEVLFDELALPQIKKRSTDTTVLEQLKHHHPIINQLISYRKIAKLISTYTEALIKQIDQNGRVHTDYLQGGAATGRLSSRNPNLQNIPVRDDNGRYIRAAFQAKAGHQLISADYNQIELVLLANIAQDDYMMKVFTEGRDLHRETASFIFNASPKDVTQAQRSVAKTINFGIIYGMSAFRLSNELSIPRKQASTYIENYFNRYQNVKKLMEDIVLKANDDGGVRTLFGRFRAIPTLTSRNANERAAAERAAINTVIQGSAADIVKQAMLNIDRELRNNMMCSKILLQVHDEIIIESPDDEVDKARDILKEAMVSAARDLTPPINLKVGIEVGSNWGEFH